jgi:hypothetical protein
MAGADGGGGVHACVGPMSSSRAGYGAPSSDPVRCNYISLFKEKIIVGTGLTNVNRFVAIVVQQRWVRPARRYCATTVVMG